MPLGSRSRASRKPTTGEATHTGENGIEIAKTFLGNLRKEIMFSTKFYNSFPSRFECGYLGEVHSDVNNVTIVPRATFVKSKAFEFPAPLFEIL